jgi:hypothetical protein
LYEVVDHLCGHSASERSLEALTLARLLLGHELEVSTWTHAKTSQLVGGDGDSSVSVDYDI